MDKILLGVDVGTSNVKVIAYSIEGEPLEKVSIPQVIYFDSLCAEQNVEGIWNGICRALKEMTNKLGAKKRNILGLALSVQRAVFVALDKNNKPLTNMILWSDKRGLKYCKNLRKLIEEDRFKRITGNAIHPNLPITKIVYLKEERKSLFDNTKLFETPQGTFLSFLGAKEHYCDFPTASFFGFMDIEKKEWSEEICNLVGISKENLPILEQPGKVVGRVSKKVSRVTGLMFGTPLILGLGDATSSAYGSGVVVPGHASVVMGTGSDIIGISDRPIFASHRGLQCGAYVIPGLWGLEGNGNASGVALNWLIKNFYSESKGSEDMISTSVYNLILNKAKQSPAGARGIVFLPTLSGVCCPERNRNVKGGIYGINPSTTKADIIRALLEGICYEIKFILQEIEKNNFKIDNITISGGAAKSAFCNQLHADIYNKKILVPEVVDTAPLGVAMCVAVGLGVFGNYVEAARKMVKYASKYYPKETDFYYKSERLFRSFLQGVATIEFNEEV